METSSTCSHSQDSDLWEWEASSYVCKAHRPITDLKNNSRHDSVLPKSLEGKLPRLTLLRIVQQNESTLKLFMDVTLEVLTAHARREAHASRPWSDDPILHLMHTECPNDDRDATSKLVATGLEGVLAAGHQFSAIVFCGFPRSHRSIHQQSLSEKIWHLTARRDRRAVVAMQEQKTLSFRSHFGSSQDYKYQYRCCHRYKPAFLAVAKAVALPASSGCLQNASADLGEGQQT